MSSLVPDMDRLLACRGLRHHTLGPTGARVFGAHLDNALGLRGRFCFRHDREDGLLRDPIVLHVSVNDEQFEGKRAACMWYPSHSLRQTKEHGLGLIEHKFVTWDDVICDVLELTNSSEETLRIGLEVATGAAEMTRLGRDTLAGSRPVGDERVRMLLAMPTTKAVPHQRLVCEITLKPGETTSVLIALAVGHRPGETQAALRSWAQAEDPLARQRRETQEWFARNCPALDCPDERFVRLWWYRWFLLRHNLTRVPASRVPASLREALPEESRAFHEAREGAQSAVRVAGAAHVLQEARWLRDGGFVHEEMRALIAGRSPEGLFRDLPSEADDEQACAEWLPVAMWGALQVWPDEELLGQAADASLKHLACVRERCDPDKNLLLGGGKGPLLADDEAPAAVEEVAHSAMFAASLQATGEMLAQAGRELDSRWHLGLAERCRAAILQQMWDEWDGFFYSLDRASGDPVRVPEAGGFAPFAFGIVPEEGPYGKALALLVDDRHFWTEHPAAQVSVAAGDDAPLAGLTLPYTNSLIAEAMAFAIRRLKQRHVTRRRLMDFLWLRSGVQSEGDDASRLACREVYDAHTGEGYGAYDCLQSCFNDLVIRHLVGVTPMPDGSLEVSPLCTGWEWFALSGVPYRGHTIDVVWDKRSERRREAETPKGLTVYVDGKLVAESPELERLPISFA